jgi:hypothetical protein
MFTHQSMGQKGVRRALTLAMDVRLFGLAISLALMATIALLAFIACAGL